jgi:hypothetical protein
MNMDNSVSGDPLNLVSALAEQQRHLCALAADIRALNAGDSRTSSVPGLHARPSTSTMCRQVARMVI